MTTIIESLIQLREAFAEQEGEVLGITLSKNGIDALNAECQKLCLHKCLGICPTCGRVSDNTLMVLGIKIKESEKASTGVA